MPYLKISRILFVFAIGFSLWAKAATDHKKCSQHLQEHKEDLQTQAGFDQTEKSDFATHGQIRPHPILKKPISDLVDLLIQLKPGIEVEGLSAETIGYFIHNRQRELSSQLRIQIESLLDSTDKHKVKAALRALENLSDISGAAQVKIAELIPIEFQAREAIDVLEGVKHLAPESFKVVAQLAVKNARANRDIWFSQSPEHLLLRIFPKGLDKDQALQAAGLTPLEVENFNKYRLIRPQPIATMGIASLVSSLVNFRPDQKMEGANAIEIGRAIRDRNAELNSNLQSEIEKLLSSNDDHKIHAALSILEEAPALGVWAQEQISKMIGNKSFARKAVAVLENHRTLAPSAYQIVAKLALGNARQGLEIWFTEDPERLLKKLKPDGLGKDHELEKAGLTLTERQDFERYGEIKPSPFRKIPLTRLIDELESLKPNAKFEGKDAHDIGRIIESRTEELTPNDIERIENLLYSTQFQTVNGALLALMKVKIISARGQLKIAQLVAINEVASNAVQALENLKWVSADAYKTVATLALSNATKKIKIWFPQDPERLLKRIQPIDGIVGVTGDNVASAIEVREKLDQWEIDLQAQDQQRKMEEVMEEQRRTNPKVRTGETDISDSQLRNNLLDLQNQASPFFVRGKYLNFQPNTTSRWRFKTSQKMPNGDTYFGVTVTTTGDTQAYEGKNQVIRFDTVTEYNPEFHHQFNLPTIRSSMHQALDDGHLLSFVESGENPGWQKTMRYSEPAENKSSTYSFGESKQTEVWTYIGDFTAPNDVKYKKCYKLTRYDSENKEISFTIFTPKIGAIYSNGLFGYETWLEAFYSK